jgi:hypothetical protein
MQPNFSRRLHILSGCSGEEVRSEAIVSFTTADRRVDESGHVKRSQQACKIPNKNARNEPALETVHFEHSDLTVVSSVFSGRYRTSVAFPVPHWTVEQDCLIQSGVTMEHH